MNIYEDEALERKLEDLTDQMGHLVLDILLASMRKVVKENLVFSDWLDSKLSAQTEEEPF
jgi:hypothetical protein